MSCDLTFSPFSKINPISRPLPVINSAQPVEIFNSSISLIFPDTFSLQKIPRSSLLSIQSRVFGSQLIFCQGMRRRVGMRGGPRRKILFDSLAPKPPTSEVQTRVLEDQTVDEFLTVMCSENLENESRFH